MKKTLHIDDELLKQAKEACGAATDTDTVRQGLKALVQKAAAQRIVALFGSEKGPIRDVPRRREPAKRKTASKSARRKAP